MVLFYMTRCTCLFDLPENVSRDVYCRKCHFGTPYALQNLMTHMLNFKISTFAEITLVCYQRITSLSELVDTSNIGIAYNYP